MSEDYKKDLDINQDRLDYEWNRQPLLFAEWAEKSVNSQYERDKKKEFLDLKRAQIDAEIRVNNTDKKITESAISALILQDKRYQEANESYLLAIRDAKIMDVARDAFEHRKRALENITQLFLSKYYAEKYIPAGAAKAISEQDEKGSRKALQESMEKAPAPSPDKKRKLLRE